MSPSLPPHPAHKNADRRILFAITVTSLTIGLWVIIGIGIAWLAGRL